MAVQTVFKQELRIKNVQPSGSIHEAKGTRKFKVGFQYLIGVQRNMPVTYELADHCSRSR